MDQMINHTSKPVQQKNNLPVRPLFFQSKLTINQPNDIYEQEADAVAGKIMHMPPAGKAESFFQPAAIAVTPVQRKCANCEEEEEKIQKKETGATGGETAPPTVYNAVNSGGQPLDTGTRTFMESRFGFDFSRVQIHNDSLAHQSASDIHALAYAHERDIVFASGQYKPESDAGKQLLAHELVHVVQQEGNGTIRRQPAPPPAQTPVVTPVPTPPPAQAPVRPPAPTQGSEFSPGSGYQITQVIPGENPRSAGPNTVQVSPGEKLIFNIWLSDTDKKRFAASQPWTDIAGQGPYEINFTITGDAEFDSAGSGTKTKTFPSLQTGVIFVFVAATWNKRTALHVRAAVTDNAPAKSLPETGSVADPVQNFDWDLIALRNPCPTSVQYISGSGTGWNIATPSVSPTYFYQALPVLPGRSRPNYQGQTILERFGQITALGFTMADVEPAWLTQNTGLTTPDQVAATIFNSGDNGTFVIDAGDGFADAHGGFGIRPPYPFKASAYADADGVGWNLVQEYVCAGTVIGRYVISRRHTDARGDEIKKV